MVVNLVFINGRRKQNDEKRPSSIELRITYMRSARYVATGLKCLPSQWKNGRVVKHPQSQQMNEELTRLETKARKIISKMEEEGMIDISLLIAQLKNKKESTTFWEFCENHGYDKARLTTLRSYLTFLNNLKRWNVLKEFSELTPAGLQKWDKIMMKEGLKQSTIWNYHKVCRMFVHQAMQLDYLTTDPYTKYHRIELGDNTDATEKCLTMDELRALEEYDFPNLAHARVRDLFIFSCYTGLAYVDLMDFDKSKIIEVNDVEMIVGRRVKTNQEYYCVLHPKAKAILEKYNYQLPRKTNCDINVMLKRISKLVGINEQVSMHWARHTCATLLLNNGMPIESVAKVMGHSNIAITQKVYAKLGKEAVLRDMSKVIGKF